MYRAIYSYEGQQEHTLDFIEDDQFTVMDTRDQYWWLVQNGFGEIGYVPANYLEADEAAFTDVIKSVDRAIEAIHFQATCAGGNYSPQQRSNLQKLLQHRKNLVEENRLSDPKPLQQQPKRQAPAPPVSSASSSPTTPHGKEAAQAKQLFKRDSLRSSGSKRAAPQPPSISNGSSSSPTSIKSSASQSSSTSLAADCQSPASTTSATSSSGSEFSYQPPSAPPPAAEPQTTDTSRAQKEGSPSAKTMSSTPPMASGYMTLPTPSKASLHVPKNISTELVEQIRRNTGLSYDKSRIAVGTVIGYLKEHVPSVCNVMDEVLKLLLQSNRDAELVESSQDAARLQVIFSEMAACKDDSQQRSWALHEDEAVITEYLQELISILNNADVEISKHVIVKDKYDAVHTLVLYYQMETRVSIRLLLLQSFGALCGIDAVIISELLNSVLPLELARDMQTHVDDIPKLSYSALVLTMIFSMGEAIPVQHYEQLNRTFIDFLLDHIESSDHEQIPDLFLNLVLAYNLHFQMPSDNDVMKALADRGTAKTFTEKIMLLVNRGDDPVRMFEHKPKPPSSLLKFMSDLYSSRRTSTLLYTNDERVLIDIVLRQIVDLSAGDKMRTEYLSLMHLILKTSDYGEHMHRRQELENVLEAVMSEEGAASDMDRRIVQQIWKDFPHYFSSFV